jgi:hypothetical protein
MIIFHRVLSVLPVLGKMLILKRLVYDFWDQQGKSGIVGRDVGGEYRISASVFEEQANEIAGSVEEVHDEKDENRQCRAPRVPCDHGGMGRGKSKQKERQCRLHM